MVYWHFPKAVVQRSPVVWRWSVQTLSSFECELRQDLLTLLNNNIAEFEWKLSVSNDTDNNHADITQIFLNLVKFIHQETEKLKHHEDKQT